MANTHDPIIVEHIFNTSIQKLWSAITELDQMKQWYGNITNKVAFRPMPYMKSALSLILQPRIKGDLITVSLLFFS